MTSRRVAGAILTIAFLLIYLPDVGHGFVRDDFMWVRLGRFESATDLLRILGENTGFYRPIVTLSFSVDRYLFGLRPLPYALTNVAIVFACAAFIIRLGRLLGLEAWAAGAAAALWAFNFHGTNMALLWISGRNALLLCLFSLLATIAALRQRWWRAAVWCLLALLSKEEAVTLPLLLVVAPLVVRAANTTRPRLFSILERAWPVFLPLAAYAALRLNSGAFGPASAPPYYQFTFAPAAVLRNVLEYFDRTTTFAAAVALVVIASTRTRPHFRPGDRRLVAFCVTWAIFGFALTVFLPLRSSLYALTPSIGAAIAAALLLQRLEEAAPERMRITAPALLILPFLFLPVYWQRNRRWVEPADASRVIVRDLQALATDVDPGTHIVAAETPDGRLDYVFSGLFADAIDLYVGRGATGEIIPAGEVANRRAAPSMEVQLRPDGHLAIHRR